MDKKIELIAWLSGKAGRDTYLGPRIWLVRIYLALLNVPIGDTK